MGINSTLQPFSSPFEKSFHGIPRIGRIFPLKALELPSKSLVLLSIVISESPMLSSWEQQKLQKWKNVLISIPFCRLHSNVKAMKIFYRDGNARAPRALKVSWHVELLALSTKACESTLQSARAGSCFDEGKNYCIQSLFASHYSLSNSTFRAENAAKLPPRRQPIQLADSTQSFVGNCSPIV